MVGGQVVDHPGVRRDLAIDPQGVIGVEALHVRDVVMQKGIVAIVAHARAEDHREVIGGFEPGGQVHTVLPLVDVVVFAVEVVRGVGRVVVPVVNIHRLAADAIVAGAVGQQIAEAVTTVFVALIVKPHHQFVLAPQPLVRAGQHHIQAFLLLGVVALGRGVTQAAAGLRVKEPRGGADDDRVVLAGAVQGVGGDLQRPVMGQFLLDRGEGIHRLLAVGAVAAGRVFAA